MKKIWLAAAAALLILSLTACGAGQLTTTSSSSSSQAASSETSSAASSAIEESSVEDNLAGLQKYLVSNASVTGTAETMRADLIGAKAGVRYKYAHNNGTENVTLELYEYDPANLNDEANKVIGSVKSTGSFDVLGTKVNAVLSDSGKYLMIYKDTVTSDDNKAYADTVKKLFTAFKSAS